MIHETADVHPDARIGEGTQVWNNVQIREGAVIGKNCNIGSGVYIGVGVYIGNNCKILNNAMLFEGLAVNDGVFIGPGACFCNDKYPRAVDTYGELLSYGGPETGYTRVLSLAVIGANATILPGLLIGYGSVIGAGAVVTKDTVSGMLCVGNPAKEVGNAY